MKKLICLNGPKGCGKTELVKYLKRNLIKLGYGGRLVERQCKDHLHELTMKFFDIDPDRYWDIYTNRTLKETPLPEFKVKAYAYIAMDTNGYIDNYDDRYWFTIREAMIYVSEFICKPTFGPEYFGRIRAESIEDGEIAIDDSTGFTEELNPAISILGQENIIMFRIYGRGNFDNDSRYYIPDDILLNTVDIWNDKEEQIMHQDVEKIVMSFIGKSK